MSELKHIGLHANRLKPDAGNPREVAFAEAWQKEQKLACVMAHLLGETPSPRDAEVAATVIQWLGSNVGMAFLRDVLVENPCVRDWFRSITDAPLQQRVRELEGALRAFTITVCTCGDGFKQIGRKDPSCFRCEFADETKAAEEALKGVR